jgi:hypothetical protein
MADDGSNIQPVLKLAQNIGTGVDDSDLVSFFAGEMIGGR